MLKKVFATAVIALSAMATAAHAGTVFTDNFDEDTQALNQTSFTQWTVTSGSVDVIGTGGPYDFYPGNGNYVDLDGTTSGQNPAGQITTMQSFAAGSYTLTFDLGGSTRGDTNTVEVALGNYTHDITLPSSAPLALQTLTFTTTGGQLSFTNLGLSDNFGLILDNVTLSDVPEPATLSLFGVGLFAMSMSFRRKARKTA